MSNQTVTPGTGSLYLELGLSQPQLITPGTGSLWMELVHGFPIVPATGSLSFTGYSVAQTLDIPSPLNAVLGMQGYAPIVIIGSSVTITPHTGAMGVVGQGPTEINGTVITPNTWTWGDPNVTFNNPIYLMDGSILVEIVLTGYAPIVAANNSIDTPAAGTLALTGYSVQQGIGTAPSSAVLAFVGNAPVLRQASTITPQTGTLGLVGQSGTPLSAGINPAVGTIAFTGYAPTFNLGITPNTGALNLVGVVPQAATAGRITPSTGILGLTGFSPLLTVPITPGTGALTMIGYASPLLGTFVITVQTGTLSFVATAALVTQVGAIAPLTGALAFAGGQPTLVIAVPNTPGTGALTVAGYAGALAHGIIETNTTGAAGLTGYAPTLVQNFIVTPGTGVLAFIGSQQPATVPQIAQPSTGALGLTGLQAIVTTQGPPLVDDVPIELLQYSVSIMFVIPGSNSMPAPTITVNENNSITVVAGPFLDINGNVFLPQALQWLLWDDTNKEQVQQYQTLVPGPLVTFEVTGSLNAINNPQNLTERRMVLVQTTLPGGEVRYDTAYYNILAVPDEMGLGS